MKQKIINPNKGVELAAQDKPSDDTLSSNSTKEIDVPNICWFAYPYPFMPMMDSVIVFDELRKMVKDWFFSKKESTIIHKKKTHETI